MRKIIKVLCALLMCGCTQKTNYEEDISTLPLEMVMHVTVIDETSIEVEMDNESGYVMDFPLTYTLEKEGGQDSQTGTFECDKTTLQDLESVTFKIKDLHLTSGNYHLSIGDIVQDFTY